MIFKNLIGYLSRIWKGRTRLTSDEARAQLRAEEAANEARKLRIHRLVILLAAHAKGRRA